MGGSTVPVVQSSAGVRLLVLSTPEDLAAGLCAPFTTHHIRESHDHHMLVT